MSFYPNGVRYISDKDNEGIETYNKETNETIVPAIKKHIGQLYFTINDLTFRENFVSSQDPEEEEHKITQNEFCETKATFGYFPEGSERDTYSISFIGTDREVTDIHITIRATDNDEDVGVLFYSSQARVDEERGSEKESIGMELRIKTSFFHRIKELVFSERMGVLILNIDGYSLDGLYSMYGYFGPFNRDKVMILDDLDMVENKEELPDTYTDTRGDIPSKEGGYGSNRKPSKKFNLMYHTKKFTFKADNNS